MREYKSYLSETLSNATQPHRWWSALKSSLFGTNSTVPALCRTDGSVTYLPQEKADLQSSSHNSKQNDKILNSTSGCHPKSILICFAFRSSELTNFLLDLDQSTNLVVWTQMVCFLWLKLRLLTF